MLAFPAALKIYLAIEPVDMRKSFNGLWVVAQEELREDPKGGAIFAFTNKKRDRLKLLYWDGEPSLKKWTQVVLQSAPPVSTFSTKVQLLAVNW